jgi:hypothetical protein
VLRITSAHHIKAVQDAQVWLPGMEQPQTRFGIANRFAPRRLKDAPAD